MPAGEPIPAGFSYPRLVPATLLPPEDPSQPRPGRRTVRDWTVDVILFVVATGLGFVFYSGSLTSTLGGVAYPMRIVDLALGGVTCLSLWFRRRWPVPVAVLAAVASVLSASSAIASIIALFSVAVHRRTPVALTVAGLNLVLGLFYVLIRPQNEPFWVGLLVGVGAAAVATAWGMFVRARRQLVWTLRERAERAEAEQRLHADQARLAERTRIAREMHDVLGHRISLLALHAGGLQVRPDLPADEVRETAGLLRSTAQQALEELRGVIGVLRDESSPDAPAAPQPTLRDISRLVDDTRAAGARISLAMEVPDDAEPPPALGRDAYRIVQEALTNVAKHAVGTATTVRVSGGPGAGLHVGVRNRLPLANGSPTLPGAGTGLVGLRERVTLAGGTFVHGPTDEGDFVIDAQLAWKQ